MTARSWPADARCVPAGSQASRCSFSQPSADSHVVEARRRIHGEDARRRPPAYRTVSSTVGIAWGVVSTAAYDGASASISMMSRKMSGGWSSSVRRSHAVSTGRGPPAYGRLLSVGRTSRNWPIGASPGGMAKRSQLPCGGTDGQSGATGCSHGGLTAPVTSEAEARHDLPPCRRECVGRSAPPAGSGDRYGERLVDRTVQAHGRASHQARVFAGVRRFGQQGESQAPVKASEAP